jgi:hypothetical protein
MSVPEKNAIHVILATDCGSTTTKAILIERRPEGYRLIVRGEAPTTVEAPFEDVTRGVLNAVREVEELSGRTILNGETFITPARDAVGVDLFVSTSSAGGGLQMMVAGVVKSMTAESAERAALGAGAIVMETLAANDGRLPYKRIERIRQLRPDMILLSGGIDGGTVSHVVEMAELIAAADPRPRLGSGYRLPVIYAGNTEARKQIRDLVDGTINDDTDRDRGWTVELAFPWQSMKPLAVADNRALPPKDGDVWRIDFSRFNQYKEAPPSRDPGGWAWSPHGAWDSHVPECFPYIHFSTEPVNRVRS